MILNQHGMSSLANGGGEPGLIYDTDFSNLDLDTGIDTPLFGSPRKWNFNKSKLTKTTKVIGGVSVPCLSLASGCKLEIDEDLNQLFDLYSCEVSVGKDSWQGLGCGFNCHRFSCPFYNCYASDLGIGIWGDGTAQGIFYRTVWGEPVITSDSIDRGNVTRIITGGVTYNVKTNVGYAYLLGRKAAISNNSNTRGVNFYTDSSFNTQMNVFRFKIYTANRYEEME